jgi:predicted ester cyclase
MLIQLIRLEAEKDWKELRDSYPVDEIVTYNRDLDQIREYLDMLAQDQRDLKPVESDVNEIATAVEMVERQLTSLNWQNSTAEDLAVVGRRNRNRHLPNGAMKTRV